MPTLSVIALTCNRLALLQRCLERLLPQLGDGDEVVLVDTGSSDGTREHFRRGTPAGVRFIELDAPGSWAEARNFGVAQARGGALAFLDDDCMVAPDWVARGKRALADADAVGGMVRPHGVRSWPSWWHPNMGWMVGLSVPGHAGPDAGRIHYPMTSNLWARAGVCRAVPFQEIGGRISADGETRTTGKYAAGREDAQWWRTLRTGGYRTRFDAELWVGHAIDVERVRLEYLRGRARMDGRAWAMREGTADDRRAAAYLWWHHCARQALAPGGGWADGPADWCYHGMARARQGEALRGLAEKLDGAAKAPALQGAFWRAGFDYALDRGRTLARLAARPWIRSRSEMGAEPALERLAVVAFGYLGDLVILQGALRGLVREYPHLTVHVVGPPAARIAIGAVQRVVVSTLPAGEPASAEAAAQLAGWLNDVQPDAIVAPYLHEPWGRTLAAVRRPARPVAGFDNDSGLTHRRHVERLAIRVHKNLEHHELANLAHLLKAVGLPCEPAAARLEPDAAALAKARSHPFVAATSGGGSLLMFNPDAGHAQKEWTDAKWTELTRRVLDETAWRIAINASRPRPTLEASIEALSPAGRVHWLRETPLEELIAWLSICRGLATVDAGPQHLAHALEVPSVTLYGPMDERRWRDYWKRPIHRTLRACAWDLTPEERRGLAENHITAAIEPGDVFECLSELTSGGME